MWKAACLQFNSTCLCWAAGLTEMFLEGVGHAFRQPRITGVALGTWCSDVIKKLGLGLLWTCILSCVALDKPLPF